METQLIKNGKHSPGAYIRRKSGDDAGQTRKYKETTITKEEATAMLARVSGQRELDENWIGGLTRAMDLGQWDRAAGRTPIAVDVDGDLINGRHRLTAFLASKLIELPIILATNCPREDVSSFDIDIKTRGLKQVHHGIADSTRTMARISALDRLITAKPKQRNPQSVLEHLCRHTYKKEVSWANDTLPGSAGQNRAPFIGALMYVFRADAQFADRVGKAWLDGGDLPRPILHLRDDAIRGVTDRSGGYAMMAFNLRMSLKLLNALAIFHQKKQFPRRITTGLGGLAYFSTITGDGAGKRWQQLFLEAEGE